jgi:hypothetical protein
MPEVINNSTGESGGGGGNVLIGLILGAVIVVVVALFAFGMIPLGTTSVTRGPAVATDTTRNIDVHVKAPPAIPGTTTQSTSTTTAQ